MKTYKEYCKEAVEKDPKTYGVCFNKDGSLKPTPNMSGFYRKEFKKKLPKNGWKPEDDLPKLKVIGTEMKTPGPKPDLTTWELPDDSSRKEYKKVWMHNQRVRQRIKKLKEQNGTSVEI